VSRAVVIGLGNPYRRDDAAGLEVARIVEAAGIPGVRVVELEGEPAGLIDTWAGADVAYVVDAVRSGSPPGTVHTLQLDESGLPEHTQRDSSHAMGLSEAVELGRVMGRLPGSLIVTGIEGTAFDAGVGLTADVATAVERVAGQVVDELRKEGVADVSEQTGPAG
jgi:hydrogenase maturation protease